MTDNEYIEAPFVMDCRGARIIGIVATPTSRMLDIGVVIVVGGPQYRVGSHRQFTLLARYLASRGIPSLRFDYRGMGDSEGDLRGFESIDDDLQVAVNEILRAIPHIKSVVLWGLCDAASAALMYAHRDKRVSGLVLLNPWVRTIEGEAEAYLRHYYLRRIIDPTFWQKLLRGKFKPGEALRGLKKNVAAAVGDLRTAQLHVGDGAMGIDQRSRTLPERMGDGLARFKGRALFILSGADLTAQEFRDLERRSQRWRTLLASSSVGRKELAGANHTFASREWRDIVAKWTADWVTALARPALTHPGAGPHLGHQVRKETTEIPLELRGSSVGE